MFSQSFEIFMSGNTFVLFSNLHLLTLFLVALICIIVPYKMKGSDQGSIDKMSKAIAFILIAHVISSPFKDIYYLENPYNWKEVLPLHMCDLSEIFVAWFLLGGPKICYKIAFFWGMAGATIAMVTPDISAYDTEYIYFFVGHGMIVLGIMFATVTLGNRPLLRDAGLVSLITVFGLVPAVYTINLVLGDPANYWYLMKKPEGASPLDFFPAPPYHILITIPIAIITFYIIYIPFLIKDNLQNK